MKTSIDKPEVNIRAAIAYLYTRLAKFEIQSIPDPKDARIYEYEVKSGDNLSAIANKHGTTLGKEANPLNDRQIVLGALLKSGALNKDRQLVHLSHVCNLQIDGRQFPVVDVMELVPGAATPRGVTRIIVLTDGLMPVQTINYTTQRPLFCKDQRLFVHGDIMIGEVLPEGNILSFSGNGRNVSVQQIDVNKLPIPATGTGKPMLH